MGKVQGVWFRAHTQKQANRLGLIGWVKNLEDGRVEVIACGEKLALEKLEAWLHQGPPNALVESVTVEVVSPTPVLKPIFDITS